jgi:hypothetical protein
MDIVLCQKIGYTEGIGKFYRTAKCSKPSSNFGGYSEQIGMGLSWEIIVPVAG